METVIQVSGLEKNYGDVQAVRGVSFEVGRGEMFGLVGPDGAGKTTIIRVLCGLLHPDKGEVAELGLDAVKNIKEVQKSIGYLSQKFSLYGDLSVDENIEFFAEIHNVKDYKSRRDELLEFTRLIKFRDRLADQLSGGMKQKLALACSLIHKPKILFLDEPTTGVDPVSRRDFWKILAELVKEGITIFMTTPYLDEAERCNRVALMHNGRIISMDSPQVIKASIDKIVVEIVCSRAREAYHLIKESGLNFEAQLFGDRINAAVDDYEKDTAKIESILNEHSIDVHDKRIITPTLENVFIHLINKND